MQSTQSTQAAQDITREIVQQARERRLVTLALAEQVKEDRWRDRILDDNTRTIHDVLAHVLAWDEWATAVFELSAVRALPEKLVTAMRDIDAFNARAAKRYEGLSRIDLLSGLQAASGRLISGAIGRGDPAWYRRRIDDLAELRSILEQRQTGDTSAPAVPSVDRQAPQDGQQAKGPSVGGLLRMLATHEREHDEQISGAFAITVDLEQMRREMTEQSTAAQTPVS